MGYMQPVNIIYVLAILGMILTVVTLFNGVLSMTDAEHSDPHHGDKLMFRRVGLQAVTVGLVVAALLA